MCYRESCKTLKLLRLSAMMLRHDKIEDGVNLLRRGVV